MKRLGLILLAMTMSVSCGRSEKKKNSEQSWVHNSASQLIAERGQPEEKSNTVVAKEGEIYQYKDKEKFQIEDSKVTAHFRNPIGNESELQYWLHQWEDKEVQVKDLDVNKEGVTTKEYSYTSSEGKIIFAVIYDVQAKRVTRVVDYAQ